MSVVLDKQAALGLHIALSTAVDTVTAATAAPAVALSAAALGAAVPAATHHGRAVRTAAPRPGPNAAPGGASVTVDRAARAARRRVGLPMAAVPANLSRPFKCPRCPYQALSFQNCKDHERQAHQPAGGPCVWNGCDFVGTSEGDIKAHIKDEHVEPTATGKFRSVWKDYERIYPNKNSADRNSAMEFHAKAVILKRLPPTNGPIDLRAPQGQGGNDGAVDVEMEGA